MKMQKDTVINTRRSREMERKKIGHSVFPSHNGALSHIVAFIITVGFVIYTSFEKYDYGNESTMKEFCEVVVRFLHLFSFATWVGVQFWVHVSGFTMYKTLTRTAFIKVQGKIFPMYFMVGVITSSISLLTHLYISPAESWREDRLSFYQTIGLFISSLCSLFNLTYLGPATIRLVERRAERIKYLGIKDSVGPVEGNLVKDDGEYMKLKKDFLMMHMLCSLVNVVCYGACGVNIWCLASKKLLL